MKHDWEYKKLGEVCLITMGQSPSSDTYNDKVGIPFFQGNADFGKEHPNVRIYCSAPVKIAQKNDILISVRAPIGAINIADRECCIGRGLASVRNGINIDSRFILYLLTAKKHILIEQGTGSTFKSIGKDALNNLPIPVPPLPTQQSIVSELDSLSKIIADYKETLKDYDALEQSIFYDMFGDPVKNDKGWDVKKLGEVCSKITDGVHSKPKYVESGVPFVSVKDITTGELIMDDVKYISKEDHIQYSKRCPIEFGDVLYTKVGATYGRPALVNIKDEFSLYVSVALLKPIHKVVNNQFLCKQLSTDFVKRQADFSIKGIGVPDLHLNMIKNFVVLVPPMHLQLSFNEKIEAIEQMKTETKKALQEAETLFNARMDYWFN